MWVWVFVGIILTRARAYTQFTGEGKKKGGGDMKKLRKKYKIKEGSKEGNRIRNRNE